MVTIQFTLIPFTLILAAGLNTVVAAAGAGRKSNNNNILVVGSINADTFLPVDRLPVPGENLTTRKLPTTDVPGGKGATQAVAAQKLGSHVFLLAQLGFDTPSTIPEALHDVDCSYCTTHADLPCGRGYVTMAPDGQVSAVVSGGSNQHGWEPDWSEAWRDWQQQKTISAVTTKGGDLSHKHAIVQKLHDLLLQQDIRCIMLQQEIPSYVNLLVAHVAKHYFFNQIVVVLDAGGQDRPISPDLLSQVDYFVPNESELRRTVAHCFSSSVDSPVGLDVNKMSVDELVALLQDQYATTNILVTLGRSGSKLYTSNTSIQQLAIPVDTVVDETGAGDCFRAAFCVALLEGQDKPLEFASAAGACAVQTAGAIPSTPTRSQVVAQQQASVLRWTALNIPRGSGANNDDSSFPFLIGSRLNSMKDRPELWEDGPLDNPVDYVRRQARAQGLTCVDFNYPQHFRHKNAVHANKEVLKEAGLVAGAVCLRYPGPHFARGSFNHPDPAVRQQAIDLTMEAAEVALELGCSEVVVWSAFDGYDYPFQVDYHQKWDENVRAFQQVCDAYPTVRISLEFKPTDENTRFFTIPSTGAALCLVRDVNRANFGLTLDVGHLLMAGENPGQSIAMVGRAGKLFGIQLNDGYTRLAAEDGLIFGSVHPGMALEVMHQLHQHKFDGHFYFDTFPQRTDPIAELEYNIARVKAFWKAATEIDSERLREISQAHNAIDAIQLVQEALRQT